MHIFYVYTCVCVSVCIPMCLHACVLVCAVGGQKRVLSVLLFSYSAEAGSLLGLWVEFSQVGWKPASPSSPPVFTLVGARVLGVCEMSDLSCGFWDPNSDPVVTQQVFLLGEPFLLPLGNRFDSPEST